MFTIISVLEVLFLFFTKNELLLIRKNWLSLAVIFFHLLSNLHCWKNYSPLEAIQSFQNSLQKWKCCCWYLLITQIISNLIRNFLCSKIHVVVLPRKIISWYLTAKRPVLYILWSRIVLNFVCFVLSNG